jgi:hypothetical protein
MTLNKITFPKYGNCVKYRLGDLLKTFNIQKHLLTLHLGLKGISKDLLDSFPLDNLLIKSDSDVCVTYVFNMDDELLETFDKLAPDICNTLKVEKSSIEKSGDGFTVEVFYNSEKLHWSDLATVHFETLLQIMTPLGIKISVNVSINN